MKVPVDDDLPEVACDFVAARGPKFNEGPGPYLCCSVFFLGGARGGGEGVYKA